MADLSLDLNKASGTYNDLLIVDNDLTLTSDANPNGTQYILQDILQRIRFFAGEWFLDNTQGVPYFQRILIKNPKQAQIDAIFANVIRGTPGVTQLSSYSFTANPSTRVLSISFSCQTTSGTVNYNGLVAPVVSGF